MIYIRHVISNRYDTDLNVGLPSFRRWHAGCIKVNVGQSPDQSKEGVMGSIKDALERHPDLRESWSDWMGLFLGTLTLAGIAAAVIS